MVLSSKEERGKSVGKNGEKMGNYSLADLIRNKFIMLIRLKYL